MPLRTGYPETKKNRFYREVTHLARVPRLPFLETITYRYH